MADVSVSIVSTGAPNGTTIRLDMPAPVNQAYTSTMTDQSGTIIVPENDILLIETITGVLTLGSDVQNLVMNAPILPAAGNAISGATQTWTFPSKPGVLRSIDAVEDDGNDTLIVSSGTPIETTSIQLTGLPTDDRKFLIKYTEDGVTVYFPYYGSAALVDNTVATLRSYLVGWGKDCVIYDNIVDVNTTNYDAASGLRAALRDSTNAVVRLNANLNGQSITVGTVDTWGAGVCLDGTHADCSLISVTSGLGGGQAAKLFRWQNSNNSIFGCNLDGAAYRGQLITGDLGDNYFIGHCTFENVHDDAIHFGGGGQSSNCARKISVMDCHWKATSLRPISKGCTYDVDGAAAQTAGRNGKFSVGRCYFDDYLTERCPKSSGGRQAHFYNNLLEGQRGNWMSVTHGTSTAADGTEGGGALCQANAFVAPNFISANEGAERGQQTNLHVDNGGTEVNSYIWYDSSYPSHYDPLYTVGDATNRFDYQAGEPIATPGSPTKADVAPVAGYYETPQTEAWVRANVPTTSGHLGSTLTRY